MPVSGSTATSTPQAAKSLSPGSSGGWVPASNSARIRTGSSRRDEPWASSSKSTRTRPVAGSTIASSRELGVRRARPAGPAAGAPRSTRSAAGRAISAARLPMWVTRLPPTPGSTGASAVVRRATRIRDSSIAGGRGAGRAGCTVDWPPPWSGRPVMTSTRPSAVEPEGQLHRPGADVADADRDAPTVAGGPRPVPVDAVADRLEHLRPRGPRGSGRRGPRRRPSRTTLRSRNSSGSIAQLAGDHVEVRFAGEEGLDLARRAHVAARDGVRVDRPGVDPDVRDPVGRERRDAAGRGRGAGRGLADA